MYKRIIRSLMFLVSLILLVNSAALTVHAVDLPSTESIYANAPKGMKLNDFITAPEYYKNTVSGNEKDFQSSNKLFIAGDSANPYANKTDILQLLENNSNKTTQIGSFWGNVKGTDKNPTYNYFDLTKPQVITAWIYNGSDDSKATDGFSFVLQNDDNKEQAISRSNGAPVGGETLGVWGGGGTDPQQSLINDYGGINKSIAIEMDRYVNNTAGSTKNVVNDYLDFDNFNNSGTDFVFSQVKEKHLSWGYPGDSSTYYLGGNYVTSDGFLGLTKTNHYYYYMGHRGSLQNRVPMAGYEGSEPASAFDPYDPQRAWRHITINYTPPESGATAKLAFKINDKYADGTIKPYNQQDGKTYNIDISKLKSDTNKVRWGFTAATGSKASGVQDVAMIMEKMPSILNIDSQTTLTDITKGISSTFNNENQTTDNIITVSDGDDVKFNYALTYTDGISKSGDISTVIGLPEHVDYSGDDDGNIGQISYRSADGKEVIQKINKDQLQEITVTVPGTTANPEPTYKQIQGLSLTIPSLDVKEDTAKVEINGVAKAPESDSLKTITVSSEHISYNSDNYTNDSMTPEFNLDNERLQISTSDNLNQELKTSDSIKFNVSTNYLRGSKFDGNDLTAKAVVLDENGKTINADGIKNIHIDKDASSGKFDMEYPLTDLSAGKTYTFKVTLTDSVKHVSNTLTYTVKIADNRNLIITKRNYENYFIVEKDSPLNQLNYNLTYDDGSNVDSSTTKSYLSVDGQAPTIFEGNSGTGSIAPTIPQVQFLDTTNLDYGMHSAELYATDRNNKSNVLTYTFKVIDKGLILKPEKDTIDIKDNNPIKINWNAVYSSDVDNLDGKESPDYVKRSTLQIKNEGDSDFRNIAMDSISNIFTINLDKDNNFSFTLNPINFNNVSSKDLNVLKEGRNELRFSITSGTYFSDIQTIVINVPHLTPTLHLPASDIYFNKLSSIIKSNFEITYPEDDNYTSKNSRFTMNLKLADGSTIGLLNQKNFDTEYKVIPLTTAFEAKSLGVTADNPTASTKLEVTDVYNRQGSIDWNFNYSTKLLQLSVRNYSFQNISPLNKPGEYIKRNGSWAVNVNSLGTKWNLNAQSDGLFSTREDSFFEPLVFLNSEYSKMALQENPIIASRDTPVSGTNQTENIADKWETDNGILLENNLPNVSGEYKGSINWTLTEAP